MADEHPQERVGLLNDVLYESSQDGAASERSAGGRDSAVNVCTRPFKWFRQDQRRLTVFIPLSIPFILASIAILLFSLAAQKDKAVMGRCYGRFASCVERKGPEQPQPELVGRQYLEALSRYFNEGGIRNRDRFDWRYSRYAPECKDPHYNHAPWGPYYRTHYTYAYDEYSNYESMLDDDDDYYASAPLGALGLDSLPEFHSHSDSSDAKKTGDKGKEPEEPWYCDCVWELDTCGQAPYYDGYGHDSWEYNNAKKEKAGRILLIVSAALLLPSWLVAYGITVLIACSRRRREFGAGGKCGGHDCWFSKLLQRSSARKDWMIPEGGDSWELKVAGFSMVQIVRRRNIDRPATDSLSPGPQAVDKGIPSAPVPDTSVPISVDSPKKVVI